MAHWGFVPFEMESAIAGNPSSPRDDTQECITPREKKEMGEEDF